MTRAPGNIDGVFPRPVVLTLLHLERRATGHWLVALQDAADERLNRKGPVSDGKHTGTQALVPWRAPGLNVPLVPGQEPALRSFIESPGVTAAGSESAETTRPDTEQVSEKQPSPFVARWRARLKRVHSEHG